MFRKARTTMQRLFVATVLCAAVVLAGCSSSDNGTVNIPTAGPEITTTPTPLLKDPVVTGQVVRAETTKPLFDGTVETLWALTKQIPFADTLRGEGDTKGWFSFLWDEDYVYVLVHVSDNTYDTGAESFYGRDGVMVFLNEDGRKNLRYTVGDAFYAIDRDGYAYLGTGATDEGFRAITFDDGTGTGYYAEFRLPLRTITGRYDLEMGFDVRVNNAFEGHEVHVIQWADLSGYTDITMTGVGTIRLD
ncbi:MAG: hypothetical protein IKX54_02730 [Lachnospiraceae bacterium]|nr:hypothetical protein [Lachnospiraceae bacterium]